MRCLKYLLTIVIIIITQQSYSQNIEFTYDDSGNRIQRLVIVLNSQPASNTLKNNPQDLPFNFNGIQIFPNPTKGMVFFENPLNEGEKYTYTVFNSTGKPVKTESSNNDSFNLDLSDYPVGLYIVKIYGKNFNTNVKIIKE